MCGIIGIYSNNKYYYSEVINLLKLLQHRGKDAYGVSFFYNERIFTNKIIGKVKSISKNEEIDIKSSIGQTKYSTSKAMLKYEYIQPIVSKDSSFALVHNGNIPNLNEFDTTYLVKYIENSKYKNFENKLIDLMNNVKVSYSIIILTSNNELYALRDRYGIRPLCIGYKKENFIVNSESYIFNRDEYIRDIKPGEIIKINNNGIDTIYNHRESKLGICSFELIYLMNENSMTDRNNISYLRDNLSLLLAKKDLDSNDINLVFNNDYIVIGIPSTGVLYGKCYANYLNLEYKQYIIKKTSERTFIDMDKNNIIKKCDNKFKYDENIKGKNIIIVDDTIVRGNIIKSIIKHLKLFGANEIHVRIPSPPVVDINQLGIAIHNKEELIMNNKSIADVEKEIGCDSLKYLNLNDIKRLFPKFSYNECFGGNNKYE